MPVMKDVYVYITISCQRDNEKEWRPLGHGGVSKTLYIQTCYLGLWTKHF